MPSQTEENYLKAIFALNEEEKVKASTNAIAERMETKASSVTDMLKRLNEKELIHYKKYQAVSLTTDGERIAISVIRKHRLWECFLVEKLGFEWNEVHDIAEQLEHIESKELTDRLDAFLDYPIIDPHGDPIPDKDGNFPIKLEKTLSEGKKDGEYTVMGVRDHNTPFFNHLKALNIDLGVKLKILDINTFDQSMDILINDKKKASISKLVTHNLYVKTI